MAPYAGFAGSPIGEHPTCLIQNPRQAPGVCLPSTQANFCLPNTQGRNFLASEASLLSFATFGRSGSLSSGCLQMPFFHPSKLACEDPFFGCFALDGDGPGSSSSCRFLWSPPRRDWRSVRTTTRSTAASTRQFQRMEYHPWFSDRVGIAKRRRRG